MSEVHHDAEAARPPAPASPPDPGPPGGSAPGGGSEAAGEGSEAAARVCEVALEEFEGPLDLLLHLVRRHELDILDIPISFVCEKYLEYIEFMRALDLEVAGDYLVMAATLAYLKSRELVPQQPEEAEDGLEDDGPDPRQQLIARLLEYQKFKDAATQLDARPIAGRDTFARGQEVELPPVDAGLAPITLFRLAEAYQRVLERARIHKSHEVVLETVSVAVRMEQLTSMLIERSRFEFEALFLEREWSSEGELRSMLVVTLMSVLELVRMGIASVHQPHGSKVILVERVASEQEAREALTGYDESLSFGDGTARASAESPAEVEMVEQAEVVAPAEAEIVAPAEAVARDETITAAESSAEAEIVAPVEEPHEAEAATEPAEGPQQAAAQVTDGSGLAADVGPDAGAVARSVVSESLPHGGDETTGSEADGQEHGQNGEAQASEGTQDRDPGSSDP